MARRPKPSGRGYASRPVATRDPIPRFLLVCEGEKTEPLYFDGFRVSSVKIEIVGIGKDPLALVDHAHQLSQQTEYDQVWCVFDRDDVPPDRFNQALALTKRYKMRVAYSNQAFELWYLLHFHYYDVALTRNDYQAKLTQLLGRPYHKNDPNLYHHLLPRQEEAMKHAQRLLAQYEPPNPLTNDPATTVHHLVQELNRFTRRNRFAPIGE